MSYYAIQDKNVGYIYFVCEAADEMAAIRAFDNDVGIDPNDDGLAAAAEGYEITELTREQYLELRYCDGTDQAAIDYLASAK